MPRDRKLAEKLEEVLDEIYETGAKNEFLPNSDVKNRYHRSMISRINGLFKQRFGDIYRYKPEVIYSPTKRLFVSPTCTTYSLSRVMPFAFTESLYTNVNEEELFKDYKNTAIARIPSAAAQIFYQKGDSGKKLVAEVNSSFMKIDEEFIINSDRESLKKVLLAATYLHFICDELDFDRGLEG